MPSSGRPEALEGDTETPLYLRRFRERGQRRDHADPLGAARVRGRAVLARVRRRHPQPRDHPRGATASADGYVTEIRIIRHGITQGYSTDAGLTPMGAWQAHQRGQALARTLREWPQMRIVCADTNRARQTAEQIHRGLLDGLDQYGRDGDIGAPETIDELKNFQVWTPDGVRDITASFRKYQAEMEKLERMAVGDRPRWLVEIDRFYRTQLGGADPIQQWLTIPLDVLRVAAGLRAPVLARLQPADRRVARAADHRRHPLRARSARSRPGRTATTRASRSTPRRSSSAIKQGGRTATVSYRNRVTEVNIPPEDEIPRWDA